MTGKEELNPTENLELYWGSAKKGLAELIQDTFDAKKGNIDLDKNFIKGPLNLRGSIYDLGQGSGALGKFPESIEIINCKLTPLADKGELQAIMPFPCLLTQLAQHITTFVTNDKIKQHYPNIYQEEINALNALAEQTKNKEVRLFLSETPIEGVYGLISAELI